jgi:hypothetical protein
MGTRTAKTTAAQPANRTDQRKKNTGTRRGGETNQYRGRNGTGSVGRHKPGGDGPGTKKWKT